MTSTTLAEILRRTKTLAPSSRLQMIALLHANGPMTLGTLAAEIGVTSSAITTLADTLEREGLAVRIHNRKDRRTIHLDLTETGRSLLEESLQPATA